MAADSLAQADFLTEVQPSHYVVGIDLGTTNSAVCYVDCHEQPWRIRVLEIPQFVAPGQVEARDTLPSFHYQPPVREGEGSGFGVQGSEIGSQRSEVRGQEPEDTGIPNPKSQIPNR